MELTSLARPELKDAPFVPASGVAVDRDRTRSSTRSATRTASCTIRSIRSRAVETFLRAAVQDPHVVAIKMTLYRIGAQLAADRSADRGRRSRQAGRGARRAEGALRRAQQHQRGRRGWKRPASTSSTALDEPEDALQAVPGRAQGGRRHPAATRTSAPATTTATPRRSTPTSACSPPIQQIVSDDRRRCSTT